MNTTEAFRNNLWILKVHKHLFDLEKGHRQSIWKSESGITELNDIMYVIISVACNYNINIDHRYVHVDCFL